MITLYFVYCRNDCYCYTIIYNEKYFSDDHFSYIVHVLTRRAYPRLVRFTVPCAQTRVAIEMHFERHA